MSDLSSQMCAVRMPASSCDIPALDDFLLAGGVSGAHRFAAKDDDDLNDSICAGKFNRVVFLDLADLLDAIWAGHVKYERWLELGVRVDLVRSPFSGPTEWPGFVEKMVRSYTQYRSQERKRQITAAVLLSLMVIVAMAALFWTIPPSH